MVATAFAGVLVLSLLYAQVAGNVAAAKGGRLAASDPEAALRSYERAVALDPSHAPHWARLGQAAQAMARRAQGSSGQALRHRAHDALGRAVSLEPTDGRYEMLQCRIITEEALAGEAEARSAFAAV